jgi:hypothetical protein
MKFLHGMTNYSSYFVMKKDNVDVSSFSTIYKCTSVMRMTAYGAPGSL